MGNADRLSRQPDQRVGVEKNNENQVFIKDCWLHNVYEVLIDGLKVNIVEKIKKAKSKDKEVVRVVEEIKKTRIKMFQRDEWQIERDLVLKKGKVYVPKDERLRIKIIQLHHNTLVAGHRGNKK